jgi:hypothetical protein
MPHIPWKFAGQGIIRHGIKSKKFQTPGKVLGLDLHRKLEHSGLVGFPGA